MVETLEVCFGRNVGQGEVMFCRSHTAGFNSEGLKWYIQNRADCDDLCKHRAKAKIVRKGFARRSLEELECMERNGPVVCE